MSWLKYVGQAPRKEVVCNRGGVGVVRARRIPSQRPCMSLSRGSPNDTRTSGWTDSHALTHFQVSPTRARFVTLNRPSALLRRLGCAQSVSCLAFFFFLYTLKKKIMAPTVYWTPPMRTVPSSMDDLEHAVAPSAKPVPTPETVPDVTPSLCLSLIEFKGMFLHTSKYLRA